MDFDAMLALWRRVAGAALAEAGQALAHLTGLPFTIAETWVGWAAWRTLVDGLAPAADGRLWVVALAATGLFDARLWLVWTEPAAYALAAELTGRPAPPLDAVGESALTEVGNVVGTAFLNVFADRLRARWEPTPPQLHRVNLAWLEAQAPPAEPALTVEAGFRVAGAAVQGHLIIVPQLARPPGPQEGPGPSPREQSGV